MPYLSVNEGRLKSNGIRGHKLTPKMIEFIDLYMVHMSPTKAVELSSYKVKDANRHAAELMQHPLIIEEIKRRMTLRSEKHELTAEFLITKLINIVNTNEADNPNTALRGIELLGKSIALWKERQEISGPDGAAIKHEQTIKENASDFTSRISGLAKRAGTAESNVVPIRRGEGPA